MATGDDQFLPSNVTKVPEPATARQNDDDGHDTESSPFVSAFWLVDHVVPSKESACPLRFTATHMVGIEHDTSMSRSVSAPVEVVWTVDHEWPLNVPTVLDEPGVPLAPTAAQKVTVGQETS